MDMSELNGLVQQTFIDVFVPFIPQTPNQNKLI